MWNSQCVCITLYYITMCLRYWYNLPLTDRKNLRANFCRYFKSWRKYFLCKVSKHSFTEIKKTKSQCQFFVTSYFKFIQIVFSIHKSTHSHFTLIAFSTTQTVNNNLISLIIYLFRTHVFKTLVNSEEQQIIINNNNAIIKTILNGICAFHFL